MPGPSPFAGDWRDCLRAHYQYVLRTGDTTTERTLVGVLHEVGFSDHDLAELKVLATLRADELPPGFVPDLDALTDAAVQQLQAPAAAPTQPEPAIFAAAFPDPAPDSEPGVPAPDAPSPDDEEPPDYRSDAPEQLSMF